MKSCSELLHSYGSSLLEWFFGLHGWMWTCFPWLVCTKSTHMLMFWISSDRLQPHLLWWLSRAGDLCSALNCHVLCTAAVMPDSTWIQQHFFYVHRLSAIQWLFFLQKDKQKISNLQYVCFIILALLWFFLHKLSILFDILVDIKAYR